MPLPQERRRSGRSSGSKPYFEGPKSADLRADQENGGTFERQVVQPQAKDEDAHDENFDQLGADHDAAFAVAVGEVTAGEREENEGQREEGADDEDQKIPLLMREIHGHDQIDDEKFYGVVVKGVLELGDDEAPEAEVPAGLV